MIALGLPYLSDFLLETIQQNNYPVISTREARELVKKQHVKWISEEEAKNLIRKNKDLKVYSNSENTIGWLENNAANGPLPTQIQLFKNKIKFRELLAEDYPDYQFQQAERDGCGCLKLPLHHQTCSRLFQRGRTPGRESDRVVPGTGLDRA